MNCDRIARYYELLERSSFREKLEERRFAFLDETKNARKAIVCGGGDGRYLARLLEVNPRVEVDYNDLSEKMVEVAQARVATMGEKGRGRVRFSACDIRRFEPRTEGYDLVVTNFFLDCFNETGCIGPSVQPSQPVATGKQPPRRLSHSSFWETGPWPGGMTRGHITNSSANSWRSYRGRSAFSR